MTCPSSGGMFGGSNEPHFLRELCLTAPFLRNPRNPRLVVYALTALFKTVRTGLNGQEWKSQIIFWLQDIMTALLVVTNVRGRTNAPWGKYRKQHMFNNLQCRKPEPLTTPVYVWHVNSIHNKLAMVQWTYGPLNKLDEFTKLTHPLTVV